MQIHTLTCLAWLYWNPSREAFTVPFLNRPVAWYGILFVLGFVIGYFLVIPIFSRSLYQHKTLKDPLLKREDSEQAFSQAIASAKQTSYFLVDRLCWFLVAGTLIGARLGVVLFYDWSYYSQHPVEIFKIWKGGLASHGGALGIALALYLYLLYIRQWLPSFNFLTLLDIISIPAALTACFIRLGNFINQEILGTATTVPWAVIFGDPHDGSTPIPRHPVQLYEALAYFFTFLFLFILSKKKGEHLRTGILSGLLLIFVFTSRFILEFWKMNQESSFPLPYIQMGQLLSLPFVLLGILFCFWYKKKGLDHPTACSKLQ